MSDDRRTSMKIILFHVASGENRQITEKEVRMICSDMISNQEMDMIGNDPIAKPEDELEYIVECINSCSSRVSLRLDWREEEEDF